MQGFRYFTTKLYIWETFPIKNMTDHYDFLYEFSPDIVAIEPVSCEV